MTREALLEKIESLPEEKLAQVEALVSRLLPSESDPASKSAGDPFIDRVRARRERLLREHGLYDTTAILRQIREDGG